MKLDRFRTDNRKTKIIISSLVLIIILLVGIIIYESYALYEEKKSFNVLNGTVPLFGSTTGEIELAYTIDGASSDKPFPKKISGYGAKSVVCNNGVTASWNEASWGLVNIENNTSNKKISCTINFTKAKVYGIERSLASSSSSWTRTNDAQGLVANAQFGTTAVQNDFDGIYPWSEIKSYNYNTSTRKITAWYGDSNFKFDGSNGDVLTYIPKFYYKRVQDEDKEYILISKKELEGYTKSEAFSVGRYPISGSSSKVYSKSGILPLGDVTITDFRNLAKNLGVEFGIMDYHYFILQLLYLVEYADYNSQAKLGLGNTNSTGVIQSGGCDNLEMHSGTLNNDGKHSMIYRGIEDIYGNMWQYIDGINIKDYKAYVCYDKTKYESDKFDGCYKAIGYTNATSNGYISKLGYDANNSLISLPVSVIGVDITYSSYITDSSYVGNGDCALQSGGGINVGNQSGLFFMYMESDASIKFSDSGARLIKIN